MIILVCMHAGASSATASASAAASAAAIRTQLELEAAQVGLAASAVKLQEQELELARLRAIEQPPKPMERGAYNARLRRTMMALMGQCNIGAVNLPLTYALMASHFGIVLPKRDRKVLV